MNCWHCKTELIWGGDDSLDESHPLGNTTLSEEFCMVSNFTCPKCNAYVEMYLPRNA
mgnify:FL=1|tara:strand:- start:2171 stop:2341 length:171 start_codon:yes stop_codon:yes gene_type:complete